MNKYAKAASRAIVMFLLIPGLVMLIGWAQLGFSAIEAVTGIRGWVWLLMGVVAGIAGFAAELSGGGR
ncbi:MAG TPA: hypothetical protein H9860_01275 [Candidatus Gemmiger faecavium]|nr:hypothetical protein [Candidatus Gemmiger faecavium]